MKPSAKVIADSISAQGHRLTTLEVVMHRFVLAEFNTHRVFSRNSASSRAIPVDKIMNRVKGSPADPVAWPREQSGMQGGLPFNEQGEKACKEGWDRARETALWYANELTDIKLHKSLINRLLEPFMWHTVIVTATEWDNFFWQRCHPDAQPEMKAAADAMQIAYYTSTPKELSHGEWHLPYIKQEDIDEIVDILPNPAYFAVIDALKKISTARCARVSYLSHDGIRSLQADIDMFETRLLANGHWSPFEHVATPVIRGDGGPVQDMCGNFRGWRQFRKQFTAENRQGFIPNLPELAHLTAFPEEGQ